MNIINEKDQGRGAGAGMIECCGDPQEPIGDTYLRDMCSYIECLFSIFQA